MEAREYAAVAVLLIILAVAFMVFVPVGTTIADAFGGMAEALR